jgi:hypothetical protein
VDLGPASAGGGAHSLDVDLSLAGRLAEVGEPPGPILECDGQVLHGSSSLLITVTLDFDASDARGDAKPPRLERRTVWARSESELVELQIELAAAAAP